MLSFGFGKTLPLEVHFLWTTSVSFVLSLREGNELAWIHTPFDRYKRIFL